MTDTKIDLDAEVREYLELTDRIEQLTRERDDVKARIRKAGPGKYETSFGVGVTVTPPPRTFNGTKAWSMLTPEQQALCVSPDPKKVKAQLPAVLVEECMEEGTGEPRVLVK